MVNYFPGMTVDAKRFQSYDPKDGGALETSGDLQTQITIDFQNERCMGGVFKQTG